jgi:SAM-dependent methyltransferase
VDLDRRAALRAGPPWPTLVAGDVRNGERLVEMGPVGGDEKPSSARIYDYFLGGAHHFEVDRRAAADIARTHPAIGLGMRANRSFLRRAVHRFAAAGADQFLDLGSGIPTVGNVHEVAHAANPEARVVYVDIEPVAVQHSVVLLADDPHTTVLHADLRSPETVLARAEVSGLLDRSRPVVVVLAGVLQYLADADGPAEVIAAYRDQLAAGSLVVMSHPSLDGLPPEREAGAEVARQVYDRTPTSFHYRTFEQFAALFAGLEVLDPGLTPVWGWPEEDAAEAARLRGRVSAWAGVGRVPGSGNGDGTPGR